MIIGGGLFKKTWSSARHWIKKLIKHDFLACSFVSTCTEQYMGQFSFSIHIWQCRVFQHHFIHFFKFHSWNTRPVWKNDFGSEADYRASSLRAVIFFEAHSPHSLCIDNLVGVMRFSTCSVRSDFLHLNERWMLLRSCRPIWKKMREISPFLI